MTLAFDHVAIGAAGLAQGAVWIRDALGLEMPAGGRHPLMGTHNRLTATGPDTYLEIIAVDPDAAAQRPRWFGLDDPAMRARLAERPRPIAWIARTDDLDAALAAARAAGLDLGRPVAMTRGDLAWRIALRDDGSLPEDGALPLLIEWPAGPHPASRMADLGLRYTALRLRHPEPARLTTALDALGATGPAHVVVGDASIEVDVNVNGKQATLR